jgi:Kef-type K+ transport system membrane component KefB
MRRGAALILLLLTVVALRRMMEGDTAADLRSTALAFGFALIAATLTGELFDRLRLPRISGYLLFGLVCGPYAADLISRTMASNLQVANGLAISLIAFVAGLEMNLARLRPALGALTRLGVAVLGIPFVVLTAVFFGLWPLLPLPAVESVLLRFGISMVASFLAVSFSPTVTIAVIAESRARGPLTDLVLPLVVLADLILIVGFALAMQIVRVASGTASEASIGLLALLSWELVGSLAFGAMIGVGFAFYLRLVGREMTVMMVAVCVLLAVLGRFLHFEIVLASLAAGLVVENIAPPQGDAMKHAVERGALPVLVIFFVAAGASLQLEALAEVGVVALGLALLRTVLLKESVRIGVRWSGIPHEPGGSAWLGLVSQGGVTLGLASLVAIEFPGWGSTLFTLILALTAIHILSGPAAFRFALSRAGEVGRMDELRSAHEAAPRSVSAEA